MTQDPNPDLHDHPPDGEPIDLSPLDPMRDPARWNAVVTETLRRVDAVLLEPGREDPLDLIASWRRPLLVAALAAGIILVLAEVRLERRESRVERIQRLVAVSTHWPSTGQRPTGADFLRALDQDQTAEKPSQ